MPAPKVNGFTVAYTAIGGVVLWSGITGTTLSTTFSDLLKGQAPNQDQQQVGTPTLDVEDAAGTSSAALPAAGQAAIPSGGSGGGTPSANQALAKLSVVMSHPSWATGTEWADWVSLWNRESGWSQTARNPQSGAYGIAQALGHGGAGTAASNGTNEYGAQYGLSAADAKSANGGNAYYQILWGIGYIDTTYGSPSAAWAHEESAGWY